MIRFFTFLSVLFFSISLFANELALTPKEQVWLEKHPIIKVSNEDDWAPFDFSVDGEAKGYSVDIIKKLAKKIGIKVQFVNGYSWSELIEEFDKKNIDLMHLMNKNKQREAKYNFSEPYMPWKISYLIRDDEKNINSPKDFINKKIAAGKGWATTSFFKKMYPNSEIIEYKNTSKMLEALSTSKVDIMIDNILAANYVMSENIITNVIHGGYIDLKDQGANYFHFVSNKDAPELVSIFNKAYELLGTAEKLDLQKKWFVENKNETIAFTKEEKAWIKNNPTVIMGGEMDWAPFDYVDKSGKYQGIIKDYIELFEQKSGLKIGIKTGLTWVELLEALKQRKIDFLPAIYEFTKERAKYGLGTKPYIKITNMMYIRDDESSIKSIRDIKTAKVAVIKGYATLTMFKPYLNEAQIIEVETLEEAIYAVLNHQVDAFFDGQLVVDYTLKENMITGLKSVSLPYLTEDNSLRMLVRNDSVILHSILEKLITSISDEERNNILDNWITFNNFSSSNPNMHLTNSEKKYLKKKKQITMCIDPDWMPFEKFDKKGNHIGMTAEYFKVFQKDIGIPINAIKTSSWSESLSAAKQRKCDIFSLAMQTSERKKYMNFTTPYLSIPLVLATKLNVSFINDFKYLKEQKIGIVKGYAFNEIIRKKYPNINVIDVDNLKDGLQKVANGELFGCIGTLATIGYMFQTQFIGELKIAGKFEEKWELGIGVRNDDLMLLNIFEKSIQGLSPEVKQTIFSKHIAIRYEKITDYSLLIKVLIAGFILMLISLYHNRKLSRINEKLKMLQEELQEQAHRDPMTNLYNRRYFHDIAKDIINISKRKKSDIGVIMIDIDNFKSINDKYGHSIGDSVIKQLSLLLISYTRQSDIVARFGGEEFVVLLPNTDIDGSVNIASKLREVVENESIKIDENNFLKYTISLGVDSVLDNDKNIEKALNRSDEALYIAKESGKNKVIKYTKIS